MEKIAKHIIKINFKRMLLIVTPIYILFFLFCLIFILYLMKDELHVANDYQALYNSIKTGDTRESVINKLDDMVNSADFVNNCIITDKSGIVKYKVNSNIINGEKNFSLRQFENYNRYFYDNINSEILYKAININGCIVGEEFLKEIMPYDEQSQSSFYNRNQFDDMMFVSDLLSKKMKVLNYIIDGKTGDKVLIIRDTVKIPYSQLIFSTLRIGVISLIALILIGMALWVYKDAYRKHANAPLWGLLVFLTNVIGLLIYSIVKQNSRICYKCEAMQNRDNVYCEVCGAKIGDVCKSCNGLINRSSNYCGTCGIKMDEN